MQNVVRHTENPNIKHKIEIYENKIFDTLFSFITNSKFICTKIPNRNFCFQLVKEHMSITHLLF